MSSALTDNPRAVIGGNAPPEPTPFEAAEKAVGDVYDEAKLWLDGAKVCDQETADGLGNLLKLIRDAEALVKEKKEIEYRPHKEACDAVVARYKPLLKKADDAAKSCKAALQPWLDEQDRKLRAEQERLRQEAEAKARAAQEALRAAEATNLVEREAAEALVDEAKAAEKVANKAAKQAALAGGAYGKSVGLRTEWVALLVDPVEFGRFAWANYRDEYEEFLKSLADRLVRNGARSLPGVAITEERKVV